MPGAPAPLPAGAVAVLAPRPATGPALAFLQLLLGPANAAFSSLLLLGILDPADELVARQGRDVLPGSECRGVGHQRPVQVCRQRMHNPARNSLAVHQANGRASPASALAVRYAARGRVSTVPERERDE